MKIGIVGLGLMGGSIAEALNHQHEIIAYDISSESLSYARHHHMIQEQTQDLRAFFGATKLVFICLYPQKIGPFILENQDLMQNGTVLIEISGIKSNLISELLPKLGDHIEVVFTHPIAGREKVGVTFAKETIFHGANFVIVPTEKNRMSSIELTKNLAKEMKFKTITSTTMEIHDDILAYTSQLTHILSLALVNSDSEQYETFRFIGDSYRDLTRISIINETLWNELFLENKDHLLPKIDSLIDHLQEYRQAIASNDTALLKAKMKDAKTRRLKIESGGKE